MRISIIGTGYVGLSTGIGFAYKKNTVTCVDVDKEKVKKIKSGVSPVYEPGLQEGLKRFLGKSFDVTLDLERAVKESEISFICVPTPSLPDGKIDLGFLKQASKDLGKVLREKDYHVVVVKSTVVPGTTENLVVPVLEKESGKKAGKGFGVCMNPEFLREGSALKDFLNPDRVVIGEYDKRSGDFLEKLYKNFKTQILRTSIKSAELIKYASNSFLAMKISFANEIGNFCKKLGIDVYEVMKGVGMDFRISPKFLNAGIGFGGSCFPKDVKALVYRIKEEGLKPALLESVLKLNEEQPMKIIEILKKRIRNLKGKNICVLGVAFKPDTDDIREAPSIKIVKRLLKEKANVIVYDPKAMENFRRLFPRIEYSDSARKALNGADACLILTEWNEFKNLNKKDFSSMRRKIIIEGRKILNIKEKEGVCW
ncbi:MAG: UDP-glucose 6-dehydrogenase [Candidatus Aenigmatarchaeota archaeon]|nr:MAG: UDP-glucose 6-dehydrogenase [Candidatus Aenigmarchaeota archaeon]